ncbi:unnamed protein product [Litomosoides sigmodontis]|uniref:Uncharacterized protein n=1 Tax=Litomosoides sigmodontis TaxID=42156 RepID=A0A3P6TSG8_LITSI|nr:unnamed protein product [Litomosoides sigmodontis]
MFLISKIVRGRRLLHELEAETEKKAAQEAASAGEALAKSPCDTTQAGAGPSSTNTAYATATSSRRRKAIRQKRDSSLSDGVEVNLESHLAMPSRLRRSSSMPSASDHVIRPVLKHYDYNSRLKQLQKRSLRFTWHRLQTRNGGKRIATVFEEVYERLLRQLPRIREMFTTRTFLSAMSRSETATPRDHAKETVKLIDYAIKNLELSDEERNDTGSDYDPFLLGKTHGKLRPYGFTGNYWEKLGEIIVDVVLAQEAVRDLPGAGQAWVIFTACLVDQNLDKNFTVQLRAGFDDSKISLAPTTGLFPRKFICNSANSDDSTDRHQHSSQSTDTAAACYSSASHCHASQSMSPEYASSIASGRSASPNFDPITSQKCERRNYASSSLATEHNSLTFQSPARFIGCVRHTKGQNASDYSPRNLLFLRGVSFYSFFSLTGKNSSNTEVSSMESAMEQYIL